MQNIIRNKFKGGNELEPFEISEVLLEAQQVENWLKDLKDWALKQALNGEKFPWMKLVEGRSNRKIKDEAEAVKVLTEAGYGRDELFETKLIGITKLSKLCGKDKLDKLLKGNIIKPQGKPTLVSETDKRPEYKQKIDFNTSVLDEKEQ